MKRYEKELIWRLHVRLLLSQLLHLQAAALQLPLMLRPMQRNLLPQLLLLPLQLFAFASEINQKPQRIE